MSVEANTTDRQGAQLSQECPPPANQPMGTNNRTAQCHWMRPLVPIGLGYANSAGTRQIVSRPAPGFSLVFSLFLSAGGYERAPPDFGFDFRAAKTEDFARVLRRLSILVAFIRRQ